MKRDTVAAVRRSCGASGNLVRGLEAPGNSPEKQLPASAANATALLAELERRLAAKVCQKVNLLIEADNHPAASFYEQNGYSTDQLIFMEKWLPA